MEAKSELTFAEILNGVWTLSEDQRAILREELNKPIVKPAPPAENSKPTEFTDFQKLLLNGPVMTDEQYAEFKKKRRWR
jgi:hypothetical protein